MSADEKPEEPNTDPLTKYEQFSDREVYESLCEVYPALLDGFDKLAQMQACMGYTDEELLRAFRTVWPDGTRSLWEEGNEFRGRLLLRGIHYRVARMRAGLGTAHMN